ncbi:Isoleucine--tRNA ligase, mitochondrial [Candida viswanathii]|uniref:isoleucine--tRNA ligase n=1 Tax=Candida viswanathii TaxID=5486 RepID=A0A367Y8L3_9ASCO|nr:Isoleucine--tRNA ligase, mitochondrial [Candida viswanathii]
MLRFKPQVRSLCTYLIRLNKQNFGKTLLLPQTPFGPKIPKGDARDTLIKQLSQDLYEWQQSAKTGKQQFTLHDGPPYANGDLHLGHALNKITKDIINRYQLIFKDNLINYRPGWDCHGLPIEMKVESLGKKYESAVEIRKACREWAQTMIERQREQFKEYAIMANFEDPYITMKHKYEIDQLKIFVKLIENGLLSQQLKPVWWGCDTQTALAEAELEYNDKHKSVAIHVKFPVVSDELYEFLKSKGHEVGSGNLKLLIWTSTPWTIPANKAVCVNSEMMYTLILNGEETLVVAKPLVEEVLKLNDSYTLLDIEFPGSVIEGNYYVNPAAEDSAKHPVLHGDHVVETAGTGLVHNAPSHGREDYLIGKKNGLVMDSVVDNGGRYIVSALAPGFKQLGNAKVTEMRTNVICANLLQEKGMLFHLNKKFTHSYPYDWRSKTPVIQRATPQWFVNVEKIKPYASEALSKVNFYPESGSNRLTLFVENRSEWCISRQRVWGVPLPIVYNKETGMPVLDAKVINHIVQKLDEFGTDEWFVVENDDISRWLPSDMDGSKYYKGKDTMDVWFDSGTSWSTLRDNLEECGQADAPLADVYLEGSDQHRGWFQSSLLNKIIYSGTNGASFKSVAPFNSVITHGFITDGKGQKMSKSVGNVFSPKEAIEGCKKPRTPYLGTDGLRLWVASSNYKQDVSFTPEVLSRVSEVGKKYRITFKYLLGNLHDYAEPVAYERLSDLDRYILHTLHDLRNSCVEFYDEFNFSRVVGAINTHVNSILSAVYFDVSKDCLYTDKADSLRRRAIQTVLNEIMKTYLGLLAPIQPLLTHEVWSEYAKILDLQEDSVFKVDTGFHKLPDTYNNESLGESFANFFELRDEVFRIVERLKEQKVFKNKLELEILLSAKDDTRIYQFLKANESYLDDLFLVSRVRLVDSELDTSCDVNGEKVSIRVHHSQDCKCPRCWKFTAPAEDALCGKCDEVVKALE